MKYNLIHKRFLAWCLQRDRADTLTEKFVFRLLTHDASVVSWLIHELNILFPLLFLLSISIQYIDLCVAFLCVCILKGRIWNSRIQNFHYNAGEFSHENWIFHKVNFNKYSVETLFFIWFNWVALRTGIRY